MYNLFGSRGSLLWYGKLYMKSTEKGHIGVEEGEQEIHDYRCGSRNNDNSESCQCKI